MSTSYLAFRRLPSSGMTKVYGIDSARHGNRLGFIRWYTPWRQYVLYPECDTLWNTDCLEEITSFLNRLRAEHKEQREAAGMDARPR